MTLRRWLFYASASAAGTWAGLALYNYTQDLLACMPLPKLW